jgi:uncharacterized protein (DUF58 family)
MEVIVYPQLVSLEPVSLPRRDLFGVPGAKSPVKDPIYTLGTRDYQPSRPSRFIHWKATARHLQLQEKVFEPSEREKILIALEVGAFEKSKVTDAFERTLEMIASLAVRMEGRGYAVGLAANGKLKGGGLSIVPPAQGSGRLAAILESFFSAAWLADLFRQPKNPQQWFVPLLILFGCCFCRI